MAQNTRSNKLPPTGQTVDVFLNRYWLSLCAVCAQCVRAGGLRQTKTDNQHVKCRGNQSRHQEMQKTPRIKEILGVLLSEAEGTRTPNHRIDSPVL
jgi:hypothetical protein